MLKCHETPEGNLLYAVIRQAYVDAIGQSDGTIQRKAVHQLDALFFFCDTWYEELCIWLDIPDWARDKTRHHALKNVPNLIFEKGLNTPVCNENEYDRRIKIFMEWLYQELQPICTDPGLPSDEELILSNISA